MSRVDSVRQSLSRLSDVMLKHDEHSFDETIDTLSLRASECSLSWPDDDDPAPFAQHFGGWVIKRSNVLKYIHTRRWLFLQMQPHPILSYGYSQRHRPRHAAPNARVLTPDTRIQRLPKTRLVVTWDDQTEWSFRFRSVHIRDRWARMLLDARLVAQFATKYTIGAWIGQGGTGRVYALKDTGKTAWAVKWIATPTRQERDAARDELRHHRLVSGGRSILQLVDALQLRTHVLLVTEYCAGGTLTQYIQGEGVLTETQARTLMNQVMQGLRHMHGRGMVHLDIKADNILLTGPSIENVRIADFGSSKRWQQLSACKPASGTVGWTAPEILKGERTFTPVVDAYSLGKLLWFVLVGQLDTVDTDHLSPAVVDLITQLTMPDPTQRLCLDAAVSHAWMVPP